MKLDNILYSEHKEVPLIDLDTLEFLERNVGNTFPDLINDNRDLLLVHQGKLELIKELRILYDNQQERIRDNF